jgi:hypothetical protein
LRYTKQSENKNTVESKFWMTMTPHFELEPENQSTTTCACCQTDTISVSGWVREHGQARAIYQIHWTQGHLEEHGALFLLIIGTFGEQTSNRDRVAIQVLFRRIQGTPQFMVVNADNHALAKGLRREEVIGTPLATSLFSLLDFVWLQDHRIHELTCEQPSLPNKQALMLLF